TAIGGIATVSATVNPHVNDAPVLSGDLAITVAEGGMVALTLADLKAADPDNTEAERRVRGAGASHGNPAPYRTETTSFSEDDIANGRVAFQHDGGEQDGSFTVALSDGSASGGSATITATVDPHVNDAPAIGGDLSITVPEGGTVVVTIADLNATDPDNTNTQLVFTVTAASHGSVLLHRAAATSLT